MRNPSLSSRFSAILLTAYCLLLAVVTGCGSHKSSLLLQRQARGPITEEQAIAGQVIWLLQPEMQTKSDGGLELSVSYASYRYLEQLFSDKQIFGEYAGLNPFFAEQVVFYVKFTNRTGKRILFDPVEFMMVDDRGNQYSTLSGDYATALAESKAPVGTLTRGLLDDAHPGYFGIGVPVGRIVAKSQRRYALLEMSTLKSGYLLDGVTYDGLVAFWSPHGKAKSLKLVVPVKTDIAANEEPQKRLDYTFDFSLSPQVIVIEQSGSTRRTRKKQ